MYSRLQKMLLRCFIVVTIECFSLYALAPCTFAQNTISNSQTVYPYGTVDGETLTILNSVVTVSGSLTVGKNNSGGLFVNTASVLSISGPLIIGQNAVGTLAISDGSMVFSNTTQLGDGNTNSGAIGNAFGSSGSAATVTGAGSTWINNGELYVGGFGDGSLLISNGGLVSNTNGYISATSIGVNGTVTVTGNESTWVNTGFLSVGPVGNGSLLISDGGTVYATDDSSIGYELGGQGTVTITGNNSILEIIAGQLVIGAEGNGSVFISNGGQLSNSNAAIGSSSGGVGTVTVTGANTAWNNPGSLGIGLAGSGSLMIAAGGQVLDGMAGIGSYSGGIGTVTVDGQNSAWTNTYVLGIGLAGSGSLMISSGGLVTSGNAAIGSYSGGFGTVTVDGQSSIWNNTGSIGLGIGVAGNGSLMISSGGLVTNSNAAIGSLSGGMGTVIVTGAGSTWTTSGALYVGYSGSGNVAVSQSGAIYSNSAYIGQGSGSIGSMVNLNQGTWTNSGSISVGVGDTSSLVLQSSVLDTGGLGIYPYGSFNMQFNSTMYVESLVSYGIFSIHDSSINLFGEFTSTITSLFGTGTIALPNEGTTLSVGGGAFIGTISGLGGVTFNGSYANTVLEGDLSYTGSTFVTGSGTIVDIVAGAMDSANISVDSGAALLFSEANILVNTASLNVGGTVTFSGPQTLASLNGGGLIALGGDLTVIGGGSYAGVIDGSGALIINGIGATLTLSGNGSGNYDGGTNLIAGTLALTNANIINTTTSLGSSNGTISFRGGVLADYAASFTLTNPLNVTTSLGGIYIASGLTLTETGTIGGNAQLTKLGDGTLVLTGANTSTANTVVSSGTLSAGDGSGLGQTVTVSTGATLALSTFNGTNMVAISGVGSGAGALVFGGSSSFGGTIVVSTGSGMVGLATGSNTIFTGSLVKDGTTLEFLGQGGAVVTIAGAITGSLPNSDVNFGSSTNSSATLYVLSSPASYNGSTYITNGSMLRLSGNDLLPTTPASDLTLTTSLSTATATFDLAGYKATIRSLNSDGSSALVTNSASGASTLTISLTSTTNGNTGVATYFGNIGGGGPINLLINGTSSTSQALVGDTNLGSGNLTVSGGTLLVNGSGQLTTSSLVSIGSGGTLSLDNSGSIQAGSFDRSATGSAFSFNGGTLTVSGGTYTQADSALTISGVNGPTFVLTGGATTNGVQSLDVGAASGQSGNLSILGGSMFRMGGGSVLGDAAGSTGSATITGADSTWNLNFLTVGGDGIGTLAVSNGGTVISSVGYVGGSATGSAMITGTGSNWSLADAMVGYAGAGTLTVSDGGRVSSERSSVGVQLGSTGSATITGTASNWSLGSGQLIVGDLGNGTLTVSGGGTVTSGTADLGSSSGSTGSVTISGAGSTWTNSGNFYAGGYEISSGGSGLVTVNSSGSLNVGGTLKIWNQGTLSLDTGGAITAQSFDRSATGSTVNFNGGTLTVSGGTYTQANGTDSVANILWIDGANNPNFVLASGTVTNGVEATIVGYTNSGALWITGGSTLTEPSSYALLGQEGSTYISSGMAFLGLTADSTGAATVSGAGSAWNLGNGEIDIGENGTGALNILAGGSVTDLYGIIGYNNGSVGAVTISGSLATWNTGVLDVGFYGTGSLQILDGGTVTSSYGVGRIGDLGSAGAATVSGIGSTWNFAELYVGIGGTGSLSILNGGRVTSGYDALGYGSNAVATVSGAGSTWDLSGGELLVGGFSSAGSLNVLAGGTVISGNSSLGYNFDSTGMVTISGAGSGWSNSGNLYVGGSNTSSAGSGVVAVNSSGSLYVGGTLKLWDQGTLSLDSGGSITATNFDASLGTFAFNGGTLTVSGGTYTQTAGALTISGTNNPTFVLAGGTTTSGVQAIFLGAASGQSGNLSILGGSTLTSGESVLGNTVGSTGSATITGTGSNWNLPGGVLTVGESGSGTLTISNGGTVSSDYGFVGISAGAAGIVTITGTGSNWTLTEGDVDLAGLGKASLTISNGGVLSMNNPSEALYLSNGGTLALDAPGSVTVGNLAAAGGTLSFAFGASTTSDVISVMGNSISFSSGTHVDVVSLSGFQAGTYELAHYAAGATVDGFSNLSIGSAPAGFSYSFFNDTANHNLDLVVGTSGGIQWVGSATSQAGTPGVWDINTSNNWLSGGSSVLYAESSAVTFGDAASTANVTISGTVNPESVLFNSTALAYTLVGGTISGNTSLVDSSSQLVTLANNNTYTGSTTIDPGATLQIGTATQAGSMNGTSLITNAGTFNLVNGSVTAQSFDTSAGTFNFNDGTLTISSGAYTQAPGGLTIDGITSMASPLLVLAVGATTSGIQGNGAGATDLVVGNLHNASILVTGGSVLTNADYAYLGFDAGAIGTVTVTGTGSAWNGGSIAVGGSGVGTLQVLAGGMVHTSDFQSFIGNFSGSEGAVTISGAGSAWSAADNLAVGNDGTGTLWLGAGGTLTTSDGFVVAGQADGVGTVTISGTSSALFNTGGEFRIGDSGTGSLVIQNGGTVVSTSSFQNVIGDVAGSTGTVVVAGAGSSMTVSALVIGAAGSGSLSILAGGMVSNGNASVGNLSGSSGAVVVSGTGSTWLSSGNVAINNGSVTIGSGASMTAPSVSLDVAGSMLVNNGVVHAAIEVSGGGMVKGSGSFDSVVVNTGGSVSPGNSPGTMTDTSTTWGTGGTYVWQINDLSSEQAAGHSGTAGGDPGWDLWRTGSLTVAPGFVIELHSITVGNADAALADFNAAQHYQWEIATSNSDFTSDVTSALNASLNASSIAVSNGVPTGFFDVFASIDMNQLWLEYTPVPEPGTLLLACCATAGFAWRQRRRSVAR